MKIDTIEFIRNLEDAIEGTPEGSLGEGTNFRELENWDSIAALMTIAMIFSEYSVQVMGDELLNCQKVLDLYLLVTNKVS